MAQKVPYFNYPFVYKSDEAALEGILKDICARGSFILQKELLEFEHALAAFVGARFAVGVANGTDAITLPLLAAGIGSGDEAIFCSHTFVATAAAIHFTQATPVPVECGPDHEIDPLSVEAAITPRTRAIVPTQLNGRTCDMDALLTIAKRHNLIVVEDAAQALGSRFKGKAAGTFGLAGTVSFYPAKSLGCFGDGGAILTNDEVLYERLLAMRDHGRSTSGEIVCWGVNSRLDNLQAAILLHKLKSFPQVIERRRQIASLYHQQLSGVTEVVLPPAPASDEHHFDTFQNFEIEAERRDALQQHLKDQGVGTLIQWGGKAVHQLSALKLGRSLPYTEYLFTRCLMLPMNYSLTDSDVHYVADCMKSFYTHVRP